MKWASGLVGVIVVAILLNHFFFKNMRFIQSEVYPDLYLVKYPVKDKDALHEVIEKMVLEKVNGEFFKAKEEYDSSKNYISSVPYSIDFYEYYTGTPLFVPFGEAGTAHFIEHKEDPGGFSSEEISHYTPYRIAEFDLKYCPNDSLHYVGTINYYQGWDIVKTEMLINQCDLIRDEKPSEPAEAVFDSN
jgi:hypothetical protein